MNLERGAKLRTEENLGERTEEWQNSELKKWENGLEQLKNWASERNMTLEELGELATGKKFHPKIRENSTCKVQGVRVIIMIRQDSWHYFSEKLPSSTVYIYHPALCAPEIWHHFSQEKDSRYSKSGQCWGIHMKSFMVLQVLDTLD